MKSALLFAAIVFAGLNFGALSRPPSDDAVGLASQASRVCNILAMFSSLMAAAWAMRALLAQLDDSKLADDADEFAAAFLAIALPIMLIAVTLRLSIAARNFGWVPIVVLGMGMFFAALLCVPVLAIVFHARWSRMPSIMLGRTG